MNIPLRKRDPGLQPERTSLSWQRTSFSSLVLALLVTRSGVSQGDVLLSILGGFSALLALILVILSLRRQRIVVRDTNLCTPSSVLAKALISGSLGLNALALMLHSLLYLV